MKNARMVRPRKVNVAPWLVLIVLACASSAAYAVPTVVFFTDFNAGIPAGFTTDGFAASVQGYAGIGPPGNQFSGLYLRDVNTSATTLTVSGLPAHVTVEVNFLLAIIDSWDGATGGFAPDFFNVSVDGVSIFSHAFENFSGGPDQTYVAPPGGQLTYGSNKAVAGWPDAGYDMYIEPIFNAIPHTASTLAISWFAGGGGYQGGDDESWAIDNVQVIVDTTVTTVPEPSGLLLLGLGLAGIGICNWRRDR